MSINKVHKVAKTGHKSDYRRSIENGSGISPWSAKELADKVGVAESTIKRMEQDEGFPIARGANIKAVYKTLANAGIVFVPENGGGVGIRLR